MKYVSNYFTTFQKYRLEYSIEILYKISNDLQNMINILILLKNETIKLMSGK